MCCELPTEFTATMCHLGVNLVPKVDITITPQGLYAGARQASAATSLGVRWGQNICTVLFLREATSLLKGTQ